MKRVVSAIVLVPLVVFVIFYTPALWFFIATAALVFLGILEFNRLSIPNEAGGTDPGSDILGLGIGVVVPFVVYFFGIYAIAPVLMLGVFSMFLTALFRKAPLADSYVEVMQKALGLVYIAAPISFLIPLSQLPSGRKWIMTMILIIWANDTFAYLVGKSIGKHKLSPQVSPGKTIEGLAGGLIGGFAAIFIFNYFFELKLAPLYALILAAVIGAVGVIGDLAESLVKRSAGVKDSGTLIPGHGGVLDRIDSLIFAIPVMYYFLTFIA